MGRRESEIAGRRERMVQAARQLLIEGSFNQMHMEDVARRAGVTRATVFNQFGSKLALLQAVAEDAGKRSRSGAALAAMQIPDALESFRQMLIEGYRFYAAERPLLRNMISLAAIDPEARELFSSFERNRRHGMQKAATRLEQQGYLKPDWSRRELSDLLWVATGFETFDLLHSGRRLNATTAAQRTLAMIGAALVKTNRHS